MSPEPPQAGGAPAAQTSGPQDAVAREALVLGHPPRIGPLTGDGVEEAVQASFRKLREGVVGKPVTEPFPTAQIPEIVPTMLRHPGLWDRFCDLAAQLMTRNALAPRDRQLAILRVLWLWQAPYAWGEHVNHAKKAGLSSEEIDRVTVGSSAPGWDDHERALLRAAEELHESAMISDATWAALAQRLDERQLIELPTVIGQFTTVAYLQNALRLRLAAGNIGLRAR